MPLQIRNPLSCILDPVSWISLLTPYVLTPLSLLSTFLPPSCLLHSDSMPCTKQSVFVCVCMRLTKSAIRSNQSSVLPPLTSDLCVLASSPLRPLKSTFCKKWYTRSHGIERYLYISSYLPAKAPPKTTPNLYTPSKSKIFKCL